MESFKEYVIGGAFLNTAQSGFDSQYFGIGKSLNQPVPTFEIPTQKIESRVTSIFYTRNPITICLEDGTTWKVTKSQWDYMKAIGSEPIKGKTAQLELCLDGTIKSARFV